MFYNQTGAVPIEIRLTFYQDRKYKIEKREVHDDKDWIRISEMLDPMCIWNAAGYILSSLLQGIVYHMDLAKSCTPW